MSVTTLNKTEAKTVFPSTTVEAKLRGVFLEAVKKTATLYGQKLPDDTKQQYAVSVHLDSLNVVAMLCEVEPLLGGCQLKEDIVKSGGYRSINEAVSQIMPKIETAWKKHTSRGVKK